MRRIRTALALTILCCLAFAGAAAVRAVLAATFAAPAPYTEPDTYKGDTAIYSGSGLATVPVNVMFLLDTSRNMDQSGGSEAYNPNIVYPGSYDAKAIYIQNNSGVFSKYVADYTAAGVCAEAFTALRDYGFYNKGLSKTSGACSNKSSDIGNYYLGNLLNKTQATPPPATTWSANKAYAVGDLVKGTSDTRVFRCIQAGTSGGSEPAWPADASTSVVDGGAKWELNVSLMEVVKAVLGHVAGAFKADINAGFMTVGPNNAGGWVRAQVKPLSEGTNLSDFKSTLQGISFISSNTSMPMNEALYDAFHYFGGKNDSNKKLASGAAVYAAPSPIQYSCQNNYVIVLTTGSSTPSSQAETAIGDVDKNGLSGRIDDAAKMLYETDVLTDQTGVEATTGNQRVRTSVIQLMTSEVAELKSATNQTHGRGSYYRANSTEQLTQHLLDQLGNFVREGQTAFVAPVVPASPENRTYSGKRIYIGFFNPLSNEGWQGNLKKFAIGEDNRILDVNGNPATTAEGTFNAGATSFWNLPGRTGDAGRVDQGGVGARLKERTDPRKIYTYTGGVEKSMTYSSNLFTTSNTSAALSAGTLGVLPEDRDKLIKFVQGYDGYNDQGNGDTAKRLWLMGDIIHSKPLVVSYKRYTFSTANEANPDLNKTFIFLGSNDGMLHCFRDVDGEEEWAFIPPDMLPRLKHLRSTKHHYYVDATPAIYVHDANGDGNIVKADGDRAVVIFGVRRGEGMAALTDAGSRGSYYAIDVSDPKAPQFLWQVNNRLPGFEEMAETWSQPRLARVKVGGKKKIVAFVGAGYDNVEDLRFGSTQTYPAGVSKVTVTDDFTQGKSADGGTALSPRGRGIYAVEIATLNPTGAGATPLQPDFTYSGELVWGYTFGSGNDGKIFKSAEINFSIPSDILALDRNHDGLIDRLYVGDTGGNLWRFNVGDDSVANWTAKKVFEANGGPDGTNGRKIFYKPDVTILDPSNVMVYFGTGDREHPQNYLNPGVGGAVVDRLYAVRDNDSRAAVLKENNLHNVTANILQQDLSADQIEAERQAIFAADNFGWYISLNFNAGEKVLAPASVFNKVVFFTTYQPNSLEYVQANTTPCEPGNLGTSRMYAVNSRTGEAVFNFAASGTDRYGESQSTASNQRAIGKDQDGNATVLRRADREMVLGGGIPSGMVFIIGADGAVSTLASADASFPALDLPGNGMIYPIYWMQW